MAEILRVSSTGDSILYKENGRYYSLDTQSRMKSGGMDSLKTFTSVGGWRRATKQDKEKYTSFVESGITVISNPTPRTYRLPNSIKESISSLNLDTVKSIVTVDEHEFLESVTENSTGLSQDEVHKLYSIYEKVNRETAVLTASGLAWMKKIEMGVTPLVASAVSFDDDDVEYYAVAPDPIYPTSVNKLYKIEENEVSEWAVDDFQLKEELDAETFEAPSIVPIDNITAQVFATWLTAHLADDQKGQVPTLYNLEEADPAENNLMKSEEGEINAEFMDEDGEPIIADGYFSPTKRKTGKTLGADWWGKTMAKQYTSAERSANASKQKRNSSGQFSKESDSSAGGRSKPRNKKKKATLSGTVTKGTDTGDKKYGLGSSSPKGKYGLGSSSSTEATPTPEDVKKLQDSIGKWVRGEGGQIKPGRVEPLPAFKPKEPKEPLGDDPSRPDEEYTPDEDLGDAERIVGEDEDDINFIGRLEAYKKKLKGVTAAAEPEAEENTDETPNTRYLCIVSTEDYDAVTDIVALRKDTGELVTFVRLRAEWVDDPDMEDEIMGLTPPPMVELEDPEQIKQIVAQVDEYDSQTTTLDSDPTEATIYTEFGEVLPISAAGEGARGTERLKQYWTHGKGAAKIRWGSDGDLTRCHRHLAKYLGPNRAWGYCQNRHQDIFGVSNAKKDKG